MAFGVDDAVAIATIIGASASAVGTAEGIASSAISAAKGNLSAAIEVYNGTSYPLVPRLRMHRHGAFLGGIEGEFYEDPGEIDPRRVDAFAVQNTAATDTIGFVLYQSPVFDFLVGWHFFDQGKIWRYLYAKLYQRDFAYNNLPKQASAWGAFFSGVSKWPNDAIWSGTAKSHDDVIRSRGLRLHGKYVRGEVQLEGGAVKLDSSGNPTLIQKKMYGVGREVNFSSVAHGAAKIMKVYVSDTGRLFINGDNVQDATGELDPKLDKDITATSKDIDFSAPKQLI